MEMGASFSALLEKTHKIVAVYEKSNSCFAFLIVCAKLASSERGLGCLANIYDMYVLLNVKEDTSVFGIPLRRVQFRLRSGILDYLI